MGTPTIQLLLTHRAPPLERLLRRGWAALPACALALLATTASARDKTRIPDLIWVHPQFDSLGLQGVALLPAVSFDKNHRNESFVEMAFAKALQPAGYRWMTPTVAREKVLSAIGDSGLAALNGGVLTTGRVDSLSAQRLCRSLRTGALMSVRVDQFEQTQVEWNQSGKPTTSVRLRAAGIWRPAGVEGPLTCSRGPAPPRGAVRSLTRSVSWEDSRMDNIDNFRE